MFIYLTRRCPVEKEKIVEKGRVTVVRQKFLSHHSSYVFALLPSSNASTFNGSLKPS